MPQLKYPPGGGKGSRRASIMGIHLPNLGGKSPTGTLNGSKLSMDVHVANTAAILVSSTSTSNAAPGAAIPAEATMVGGTDGGILRAVAVNATGQVQVDQLSTLATQATLSALNAKFGALGQAAMAASAPVVIASDQSAVPVSAASLPLPTGAATEATLSAASAKLPATLGQKAMAASLAVAIASDQSTLPVSAASLPLPSGAATEATLSAASAKLPATLGQKVMASSLAVAISSDQSTLPVSAASLPLPSGAATEATLAAASAKLPATLGAHAVAASLSVTVAPDQGAIPVSDNGGSLTVDGSVSASNFPATVSTDYGTPGASTVRVAAMLGVGTAAVSASNPVPSYAKGRSVVTFVRNDYSSVNVTTAAYVELIASTGSEINQLEIFDSSGETLKLALGAAASEVDLLLVTPGGNGIIPVNIPAGTRVSIRAVSATASVGEIDINCYS